MCSIWQWIDILFKHLKCFAISNISNAITFCSITFKHRFYDRWQNITNSNVFKYANMKVMLEPWSKCSGLPKYGQIRYTFLLRDIQCVQLYCINSIDILFEHFKMRWHLKHFASMIRCSNTFRHDFLSTKGWPNQTNAPMCLNVFKCRTGGLNK